MKRHFLPKNGKKMSFRAQGIAFMRKGFRMKNVKNIFKEEDFMRTKRLMPWLSAMALLTGVLLLTGTDARAATKINTQVLSSDQKSLYSVDLDGDGKKENLSLKTKADKGSGNLTEASLIVNDKAALTFKKTQALSMTVDSVHLAEGDIYLRVLLTGANDFREFDSFYRYDAGKKRMVKQLELMDSGRSGVALLESVRGMDIQVRYEQQFSEVGRVSWKSTYTSKDGKLELKSASAPAKCVDPRKPDFDDYGKLFAKNKLKAKKSVRLYADTSLKKTASTAKKGDVLTLKTIKYAKGKFYVQFAKGGKSGWMQLKDRGTTPFEGVMDRMAG